MFYLSWWFWFWRDSHRFIYFRYGASAPVLCHTEHLFTSVCRKNKNPVPAINNAGTGKIPVVPPCLTLKMRPLTRTDIRWFCWRSYPTPAHILRKNPFPFALRSPFGSVFFCRNHTACGSLEEQVRSLLTLHHRFDASIISRHFSFVNSIFEFFRIFSEINRSAECERYSTARLTLRPVIFSTARQ